MQRFTSKTLVSFLYRQNKKFQGFGFVCLFVLVMVVVVVMVLGPHPIVHRAYFLLCTQK